MQIVKTPYLVSLAGNPMRYTFHVGSNDPGIKGKMTLAFTEPDTVADHVIEFTLMGQSRSFILKDTPALDYELPVAGETELLEDWLDRLITAMLGIEEIDTYYTVTAVDGTDIVIESKEENPANDIEVVEKNPIAGITCEVTPGETGDPGVLSQLYLIFSEKDYTEDHQIELTVMGRDRALIIKDTPSSDWEIPAATELETLEQWVARVLAQLQDQSYESGAVYEVADYGSGITITAHEANPYFDITVKEPISGVTAAVTAGELPAWDYGAEYDEGQKATTVWGFTDKDTTADNTMECTIMGQSRTFILKADVGNEWELPVALEGESLLEWVTRIYETLLAHYTITTNYDVSLNDQASASSSSSSEEYYEIVIIAKDYGPDYDFITDVNNIAGITVNDDTVGYLPNWTYTGVLMQVRRDSATGTILGEDVKSFDVNNSASFDVSEYLYAELLNYTQRHFYNSLPYGIVKYYTDYVLQYYVSFFPKTANNEYGSKVSDIKRYALGGGFSREMLVKNNLSNIDWFSDPDNAKKFLSWCPSEKFTDMQEKISLFFLIQWSIEYAHYDSIWLSVDFLMDDGNTIHGSQEFTPVSNIDSVLEFTVGYNEIKAYFQPYDKSRDIIKWDVCIKAHTDAVEIISEIKTFILDPRYYENTRYFRFRNSFGAYDSLLCTGKFESFAEYERVEATYINFETLEYDINAERFHTKVAGTKYLKANTGFLRKEYLEYLGDFLLSREIYEYLDGQLQRILIRSKKVDLIEDKVNLYNLSFDYEYASQNEFHSNI